MKRNTARVKRVEYVGDDIVILYFEIISQDRFTYEAGQYITVFFDDSSTPAGKAYSISSAPHEKWLSIMVKRVGEFSGRLYDTQAGDEFEVSDAYGHFNPHTDKPIIALAAGVGVAPIWSIVKHELACNESRQVHVCDSNASHNAIAHHEEIKKCAAHHEGFTVHHHITRSESTDHHHIHGRIDLDACMTAMGKEAAYLICGSVSFVRDMWRGLLERGVPREWISTETFFE